MVEHSPHLHASRRADAVLATGARHPGVSSPDPPSELQTGFTHCRNHLLALRERPGCAFSDSQVLAHLLALQKLAAAVEAASLKFVYELTQRPDAVPGGGALGFLTERMLLSRRRAHRELAAARAIASTTPEMPLLGSALADGDIHREHVDVAVSTLSRIPKVLRTRTVLADPPGPADAVDVSEPAEGGPAVPGVVPAPRTGASVIDEILTDQSRHLPPSTVERLGRQIVHRLDPDRAERFDADAVERRTCTIGRDFAGMGIYRVFLDPATDVMVRAAIAQEAAPRPIGSAVTSEGTTLAVRDTRTLGQRQADALVHLVLAGARRSSRDTVDPPGQRRVATPASADAGTADPVESDHDGAPRPVGVPGRPVGRVGEATDRVPDTPDPARDTTRRGDADSPFAPDRPPTPERPRHCTCGGTPGSRSEGGAVPQELASAPFETLLLATVDQLAAAFGADDSAARSAGLARTSLAGRNTDLAGSALPPDVLARLACDSPIRRVLRDGNGAVLDLGRARRLATTLQKRALAARDGGCCVPGCHVPPEWCDAHHVTPWSVGGTTDVDALALLCGRHHTAVHAGSHELRIRRGVPWVRLPAWQDPLRRWLRNRTHEHPRLADTVARLVLGGRPSTPRRQGPPGRTASGEALPLPTAPPAEDVA